MQIRERVTNLNGRLAIKVYRSGRLYVAENIHNLIVTQGRNNLAKLLAGQTGMHVTHVGIGTGTDAAVSTDTALTGVVKVAVSEVKVGSGLMDSNGGVFDDPRTVQFHFRIGVDTGVGMSIGEYGLYCADGTLFSHIVRASAFNKTAIDAIEGYWQIQF